jgi:hypothetical protein|tara:strand:- start:16 stop:507 length:492 start_codon:yes stop_codon:yes gene_type:complete
MADFTCDTNYLAPTGFKITVSRENFPNLQFFAQQVMHPSMEMSAVDVPYRRAAVAVTGDTVSFGMLSMDIMMDEKMNVYEELFQWLERMVEEPHRPNTGNVESVAHYCDIRVQVLNSSNNIARELKYINSFPISLGDITFAATSEGQYITFPVTFKFDYFDFV